MSIHFTIQADDPEVEKLLAFIKTQFPDADAYDHVEIVKRTLRWLEMQKDGAPGSDPAIGILSVLRDSGQVPE